MLNKEKQDTRGRVHGSWLVRRCIVKLGYTKLAFKFTVTDKITWWVGKDWVVIAYSLRIE